MSDSNTGHAHRHHDVHHAREHHGHEETARQAAHETALRLLAESKELHVPAGGGPFQAIKNELPDSGDKGPAALAHMINQETGKTSYRKGEVLPIPHLAIAGDNQPAAPAQPHPRLPVHRIAAHDTGAGRTSSEWNSPRVNHQLNGMLNDLLRRNGIKPIPD